MAHANGNGAAAEPSDDGRSSKRARTATDGTPMPVVFHGEEDASFSAQAARSYFEDQAVEIRGVTTLRAVFEQVERGDAKHAVVPIENSSSGSLHRVYDLLLKSNLHIVGEIGVLEDYCLIAPQGVSTDQVKQVVGHPHILDACASFLERQLGDVSLVPALNSAAACRDVAAAAGGDSAAVAPEKAATRCGLAVVSRGIADDRNIESRYLILGKQRERLVELQSSAWRTGRADNPCFKTSVVLALPNTQGSIHKVISQFALRGLNILKVETRPASTAGAGTGPFSTSPRHWDYLFYIDFEPSSNASTNQALMTALAEFSLWFREFGTYQAITNNVQVEKAPWVSLTSIIGH